ncbi:flagellar motor switch protein FliM [Planctomycetes bacterium Pla163]|uniref:Flagellar motor switch protein FliM n=1 Tax=Rohdeia mirabilis TaxID=2528008 RepID=A0A518D4V5_9BACT|nr:flagellar motor switch protein FliM [Planctomycetes bacterium Pla163]
MSTNLSSEELRALAASGGGDGATVAAVSQWDRGRVHRLSSDDVAEARRRIGRSLPKIESLFAELAGLRAEVRLGACHEVDAEGLLDDVEDPPALVCFRVGGQPGWCLWDNPIAIATIEDVLGGAPPPPESDDEEDDDEKAEADSDDDEDEDDGEPAEPAPPPFDPELYRRALTPMERRVLVRVLRIAIDEVASVVGVDVTEYAAVSMLKYAPTWRESIGARPDPHRLAVELVLETERGETALAIHLPMAGARRSLTADVSVAADVPEGVEVPEHLDAIPVQLQAELGTAELTLNDLIGLEPGDVIPIDAAIGDPIHLRADGVTFALGRLGTHRGHVAIRLDRDARSEHKRTPPTAETN